MADTQDWESALDDAQNSAGKPLQATPQAFATYYGDAINSAAKQLNVDPSVVAGQWGLETGWGKSVVPGTNNLGNIKDPSGKGPTATDNQTGSKDSYASYNSAGDFSDAYVNLIKSKYPNAIGAKDATSFANALQKGGYAEDKNYVNKVSGAAGLASKVLGAVTGSTDATASEAQTDWDAKLTGAGLAPQSTPPDSDAVPSHYFGIPAIDGPVNSVWNTAKNIGSNVADGATAAWHHPLDAAKGVAASAWNPLINAFSGQAVAEASQAPNSNINVTPATLAAQKAVTDAANITPGTGNKTAFGAGQFAGNAAISTAAAAALPELKAAQGAGWLAKTAGFMGNQAVQGGAQAAASTALDGGSLGDVAKSAGIGAAANMVLGPLGHGVVAAAKPVVSKFTGTGAKIAAADAAAAAAGHATGDALSPAEQAMAGKMAQNIDANAPVTGQGATDVANQLQANATSPVPGVARTAAEATDNPIIQATQQGLDKSGNNGGLAARDMQNANANTDYLRAASTSDTQLQGMKDAFQAGQDQIAAKGNAELGAVTPQQDSAVFDTPAMQKNLGRANTVAQNDGSTAIQQAFDAPNDDMVAAWNGVKGSDGQTAQLEKDRFAATSPAYESVLGAAKPLPVTGQLDDLLNTPIMQKAIAQVQNYKLNALDDTPVINRGAISPQDLNIAKMHLDDYIQRMSNPMDAEASADKWQKNAFIGIRNKLNGILENNVSGFKQVNAEFAKRSDQIAESKFLTDPGMVDKLGKLNVSKLDSLVKQIEAGKANNNPMDPAKAISHGKLAQLQQLRDDAVASLGRKSAEGIHGDSYNYLRQAAQTDPVAAQQLRDHLTANSPAYKQFYDSQAAGEKTIAHQSNMNDLVKKFDTRADGNVAWHDVRNLHTSQDDFAADHLNRLQQVRDNLQRHATRTEQVSGSPTASNLAKREGFENLIGAERGKGFGNWVAGEQGERAARILLGPPATVMGAKLGGHLGATAGDWIADKASSKIARGVGRMLGGDSEASIIAKTAENRDAVEKLLLHPKRLGDAIHALDTASKTKKAATDNLLSKMNKGHQVSNLLTSLVAGQTAAKVEKDTRKK